MLSLAQTADCGAHSFHHPTHANELSSLQRRKSMRRCPSISTPLIAGLLVGLLFAILAVPLVARTADSLWDYDPRQELTINGTVSSVLERPTPGMIWGSHLVIDTLSSKVDASLGRWALVGKGALHVTPGQQVEVTGVMKYFNEKQVLLVRTVTVNGKPFAVRNRHGMLISPQTREIAAQRGETL
jgi:hypothetical protein